MKKISSHGQSLRQKMECGNTYDYTIGLAITRLLKICPPLFCNCYCLLCLCTRRQIKAVQGSLDFIQFCLYDICVCLDCWFEKLLLWSLSEGRKEWRGTCGFELLLCRYSMPHLRLCVITAISNVLDKSTYCWVRFSSELRNYALLRCWLLGFLIGTCSGNRWNTCPCVYDLNVGFIQKSSQWCLHVSKLHFSINANCLTIVELRLGIETVRGPECT